MTLSGDVVAQFGWSIFALSTTLGNGHLRNIAVPSQSVFASIPDGNIVLEDAIYSKKCICTAFDNDA